MEQLLALIGAQPADAMPLLAEFGTLAGIFAADAEAHKRVTSNASTLNMLALTSETLMRTMRRHLSASPVLASSGAVEGFMRVSLGHRRTEGIHALYLDAGHRLIKDEMFPDGEVDHAMMPMRRVVRRCLELEAVGLIIAHNHPGGSCRPSAKDLSATRALGSALAPLGVRLIDHLVVTSQGAVSFKAEGLL